ncbi:MAG TPA: hypothetical protein VHL11_15085 [Phototrophicaceae bacterium]|jgi:hypothetical protein|nr:hypothetical protein [Phototrophicaceae bacterium]
MKILSGLLIVLFASLVLVASPMSNQPVMAQEPVATPATPGDAVAGDIVDLTVQTAEGTANFLEDFLNRLIRSPQSEVMRILLVVGGVILLAVGWRIYDEIVIIAGFLIGASIAVSLVTTNNTLLLVGALLIGGLIGAALSAFLYYVAVFLIGAYIGILLTSALATALSMTPISAIALLIGGVIGGLVLLGLSFEFLVLLSSLVGAQMLSLGLGLGVVWTLLFALMGVIIQLGLMRTYKYDFRRRRRPIALRRRLAV